MSVGFIGAGQLAHALVKGFTAAGEHHWWVGWLVLLTQGESGGADVSAKVARFSLRQAPRVAPCLFCNTSGYFWPRCSPLLFSSFFATSFPVNFTPPPPPSSGSMLQRGLVLTLYPFIHTSFLSSFPPQGVIAAQKITASSPDTDLPTVMGLRVRSSAFVVTRVPCAYKNWSSAWSVHARVRRSDNPPASRHLSSSPGVLTAENGGEHDDQQQGDRQQERRALSGREASHHPLRPGRDWAQHRGSPPHRVLCGRGHHQLHREGQSTLFLTNPVKLCQVLLFFTINFSF